MGALHAGHASLIRAAQASCTHVAVSIFVNPTQFAPNEDYARYPRTFEPTAPSPKPKAPTWSSLPRSKSSTPRRVHFRRGRRPEQPPRRRIPPGHFRGVATVVAKLLIAAEPDRAFFGQKDAAQVAVLRRMVADLRSPPRS
jgi:pantoate--beta-alanine ligase